MSKCNNNNPNIISLTDDTLGCISPSDCCIKFDKEAVLLDNGSIQYFFHIENTCCETITSVVIADTLDGLSFLGTPNLGIVEPLSKRVLVANYTPTSEDKKLGVVTNKATATITKDDGSVNVIGASVTTLIPVALPHLSLEKSSTSVKDKVKYTITIVNDGDLDVTNIDVSDILPGFTFDTASTGLSLVVGETLILTGKYTATPADILAGFVKNKVTAVGTDENGNSVTAENNGISGADGENGGDTLITPIIIQSIDPTKTGVYDKATNTITYTITVLNDGNVDLENLLVTEELEGVVLSDGGNINFLAVGDTATITGIYKPTSADFDKGEIVNNIAINGKGISSTTGTLTDVAFPAISLDKTSKLSTDTLSIEYTLTVKNTGNTTLSGVEVTDPLLGAVIPIGTLAVNETKSVKETYKVTDADRIAGTITNVAGVTSQSTKGVVTGTSSTTTTIPAIPSKVTMTKVVKEVIKQKLLGGEDGLINKLIYLIRVENTGAVALTNVKVEESLYKHVDKSYTASQIGSTSYSWDDKYRFATIRSLAIDEVVFIPYVVQVYSTDTTKVNVVTLTADELPTPLVITNTYVTARPLFQLYKSGEEQADGSYNFSISVKNTGNVDIVGLVLTDERLTGAGGGSPQVKVVFTEPTNGIIDVPIGKTVVAKTSTTKPINPIAGGWDNKVTATLAVAGEGDLVKTTTLKAFNKSQGSGSGGCKDGIPQPYVSFNANLTAGTITVDWKALNDNNPARGPMWLSEAGRIEISKGGAVLASVNLPSGGVGEQRIEIGDSVSGTRTIPYTGSTVPDSVSVHGRVCCSYKKEDDAGNEIGDWLKGGCSSWTGRGAL